MMEKFARTIVGYHGCDRRFAKAVLSGETPISDWKPSQNQYDWLGEGVYFWEHSPRSALRWAEEKYNEEADVLGAVIQLGSCLDLLDEGIADLLAHSYQTFRDTLTAAGIPLPINHGKGLKMRDLDCAVINNCVNQLQTQGTVFDTVRGAFLEGEPLFPALPFPGKPISRLRFGMPIAS